MSNKCLSHAWSAKFNSTLIREASLKLLLWFYRPQRRSDQILKLRWTGQKRRRRDHMQDDSVHQHSANLCVIILMYLIQRRLLTKYPWYRLQCYCTGRLQKHSRLAYTMPWSKSLGGAGACWANSARLLGQVWSDTSPATAASASALQ